MALVGQYGPQLIVDTDGRPVPNTVVPVVATSGATTLYTDNSGSTTVPQASTDGAGLLTFFAPPGNYSVASPGGRLYTVTIPPPVVGVELGRAETAVVYTLTTSMVAVPGLAVPANVPPGVGIFVECECPWVAMGSVQTYVALRIFEDSTQLKTSLTDIIVSKNGLCRVSESYNPTTPGLHTYTVQAQIGVASAGAAIEAGGIGGSLISPYLRVVTC